MTFSSTKSDEMDEESRAQKAGDLGTKSTFPVPPSQYKRYARDDWLEDKTLQPPAATQRQNLTAFGRVAGAEYQIASLKEQRLPTLYDTESVKDLRGHINTLKRLNHSILFNYLELVKLLQKCPEQWLTKVQDIENLLFNFHHLLNECRYPQAQNFLQALTSEFMTYKRDAILSISESEKETQASFKGRKFPPKELVAEPPAALENGEPDKAFTKDENEWYKQLLQRVYD